MESIIDHEIISGFKKVYLMGKRLLIIREMKALDEGRLKDVLKYEEQIIALDAQCQETLRILQRNSDDQLLKDTGIYESYAAIDAIK